jgi:signal transduction histidine kinase
MATARALDTFGAVIFRGMAVLRLGAIAYTATYVGIWWHSWYGPRPWRLVAPLLVLAWSVVFVLVATRRALPKRLVALDVTVGALAALTAPWTLPAVSVGDPSSWEYLAVLLAALSAACAPRTRWALAVLVALAAVHLATGYGQRPQVLTATVLLVLIVCTVRQAIGRLARVAGAADAWLDASARRSRAEAVAAARARARRVHERFLHDTVLNELAGIGLGGVVGADEVTPPGGALGNGPLVMTLSRARARCRRIVNEAEHLLADAGGDAGPLADADAELTRLLGVVAEEAAETGLAVSVHTTRSDQPRWSLPSGDDPASPASLPGEVVLALAAAVREALTNVRRHSGVRTAQVVVRRWSDGVRVRVLDAGLGFDATPFEPEEPPVGATVEPDGTPPAGEAGHLGIRRSLHGRMADVGGWARIISAPGEGTRVELAWRAVMPPGQGTPAAGARLRDDYEGAIRRGVGVALLADIAVLAVPAVVYRAHSVVPVLSPVLWLVLAAGSVAAAAVTWRRRLTGVEALAVTAFTILVVLFGAALTRGDNMVRIYDWAGTMAPPVLLLPVTTSRRTRQWGAAIAVVIAAELAVAVPRLSGTPLALGRLLYLLYGIAALQLLVTVAGPVLRATAETTTRAAALDAELGARQAAAAAVRRDQARRLARLDRDVLPLLRAVADGSADPRTERVRQLCDRRGRALRRMLHGSGGRGGTLGELEMAIDAAEALGALVVVQIAGDLADMPGQVRDEIVDLVGEQLRVTPPGRVTVTLWCDRGEGYLSCPAVGILPAGWARPWEQGALAATVTSDEDELLVELRWTVPTAAPAGTLAAASPT